MGNTVLKKNYLTAEKNGILNLSGYKLNVIPIDAINIKSSITNLDMSKNKFTVLPGEIGLFVNLKVLNVDSNGLTVLPEEIGTLKKLEKLFASNNKLTSLPKCISGLLNLKEVRIGSNDLKEFPIIFCTFKKLQILDVSNNGITSIPPEVGNLSVTELILNKNKIKTISPEIAKCENLQTLRIQENGLLVLAFPTEILHSSKVSNVDFAGNNFDMEQFGNLDGYDAYMERNRAAMNK